MKCCKFLSVSHTGEKVVLVIMLFLILVTLGTQADTNDLYRLAAMVPLCGGAIK